MKTTKDPNILLIGDVSLFWKRDGTVAAYFIPATYEPEPQLTETLSESLASCLTKDEILVKAELVLGGWFSQLSHIELADRSEWEIKAEVSEFMTNERNRPTRVKIRYFFKKKDEEGR